MINALNQAQIVSASVTTSYTNDSQQHLPRSATAWHQQPRQQSTVTRTNTQYKPVGTTQALGRKLPT